MLSSLSVSHQSWPLIFLQSLAFSDSRASACANLTEPAHQRKGWDTMYHVPCTMAVASVTISKLNCFHGKLETQGNSVVLNYPNCNVYLIVQEHLEMGA